MGIAALFVVALEHGMLRLARLERRRLCLLSILISHLFGLGCRSISNQAATLAFLIASKMTLGTTAVAAVAMAWSLLALLALSPRILRLPARAVVRDRPVTTATAVVVCFWCRAP
jgi:hypothetical protein